MFIKPADLTSASFSHYFANFFAKHDKLKLVIACLASAILLAGTAYGIYSYFWRSRRVQPEVPSPFIQKIHNKVLEVIYHADNIPGLKAEEFNTLKDGIADRWAQLVTKGVLEVTATDQEVRPYFVALQAVVEHVLAQELNKSVSALTGVIHTPMPATPLCTEGEVSNELVDPAIRQDPLRAFTVKARTTIIRDYLFQGGDLYVVYPKEGITKRTEGQQQVYRKELQNYPAHLFDRPLECASIDPNLIGAFYLFSSTEGKTFGFAIKMTQANDPQEKANFCLWLGEADKFPIADRLTKVLDAIVKHSPEPIILPNVKA